MKRRSDSFNEISYLEINEEQSNNEEESEEEEFNEDEENEIFFFKYQNTIDVFSPKISRLKMQNFKKTGVLNQSRFSRIIKLVNIKTHKEYAGKVTLLKPKEANKDMKIRSFFNGANILSEVSHPSIMQITGCTTYHRKFPMIITEYYRHGSLENHLQ